MQEQRSELPESGTAEGLLRGARRLLWLGVELEAVRVLHLALARSLEGVGEDQVPTVYSSSAEAWRVHERLRSSWQQGTNENRLATVLGRRRPGFFYVAGGCVFLLLTLRYVWAVSHGDWSRQHPEGNWLSRAYGNDTFEGNPLVRYDIGVNSDFGVGAPADSMKKDFFSVRWDTCLVVKENTSLRLQLDADDRAKLLLDDVMQFEVAPGPGTASATLEARAGVRHLSIEFVERWGTAMVRLSGLDPDEGAAYYLQRPVIEGAGVRCR